LRPRTSSGCLPRKDRGEDEEAPATARVARRRLETSTTQDAFIMLLYWAIGNVVDVGNTRRTEQAPLHGSLGFI
jgi:predicted secreted protein